MDGAAMAERRCPSPAVVLAAIVVVSTVVRGVVAALVPTPWINPDEIIYAELGRSLWHSGHMTILGVSRPFYSLLYPALVGGPLALGDAPLGYALVKWLQALLMSATAVPVYLWGRHLYGARSALVAAALTIALPGLAYAGLVMSDVAFFPAIVFVGWTWARALETPTARWQALAVGTVVVALLVRVQALVLLPALPTAIVLLIAFERAPLRALRRYGIVLLGIAGLAVGWAAWQVGAGGQTATSALGAYRAAGEATYSASAAARFVVYHAADVLLVTGLIPACVVCLLLIDAVRGRERSPAARALLAVTASMTSWFVVEVGVFASHNVGLIAERNLFCLAPFFFLGFVLWLERGGPRERVALACVAALSLALLVALPLGSFVRRAALPDTFSLIPLYDLRSWLPRLEPRAALADVAVALLALLVFVRTRLWALALVVFVVLAGTSVAASIRVVSEARAVEKQLLGGPNRDWIADHANGRVAYVYAGEAYWNAIYENRFWSPQIDRVYTLPGPPLPGPFPDTPVGPLPDGRVVAADGRSVPARNVVASNTVSFFGDELAQAKRANLALWRVRSPLRMSTWLIGMAFYTIRGDTAGNLEAQGDVSVSARLVVYSCARGLLKVSMFADRPATVRIDENGRTVREAGLVVGGGWSEDLPLHPAPAKQGGGPGSQCTFEFFTSGIVHFPRFELLRR